MVKRLTRLPLLLLVTLSLMLAVLLPHISSVHAYQCYSIRPSCGGGGGGDPCGVTGVNSPVWSGYEFNGYCPGTAGIGFAQAQWQIPTVSLPSSCPILCGLGIWVGLADCIGACDNLLVQAGISVLENCNGLLGCVFDYKSFYQFGAVTPPTTFPCGVSSGDLVSVTISEPKPNNFKINFYDATKGQSCNVTSAYTMSPIYGDFITERPQLCRSGLGCFSTDLPVFSEFTFENCAIGGSTSATIPCSTFAPTPVLGVSFTTDIMLNSGIQNILTTAVSSVSDFSEVWLSSAGT